ncbi:Predicted Zn-dependent protease [Singulisphaera sp. GP187]|nr:Predicted Zn-dependent protease [Singulisphaera sp. GP187]
MVASILLASLLVQASGPDASAKLPDFKKVFADIERFTEAKRFVELAQLYADSNEQLRSPLVAINEAVAWADAGRSAQAIQALEHSIEYGIRNPNVVTKYKSLGRLKSDPAWPRVESQLAQLRRQLSSVDGFEVHTDDAEAFWKAFDLARAEPARAEEFFSKMILDGSPALRDYYANRYFGVDDLVKAAIQTYPKYYQYLRNHFQPEQLGAIRKQVAANMRTLTIVYPEAIFPHGYLVIGTLNSAGSATDLGVFIGLDRHGRGEGMPTDEMSESLKKSIGDPRFISGTMTHELMHFQQNYRDPREGGVLRAVIEEGVCDFLTDLVTGKPSEGIRQRYLKEHEAEILEDFRKEMNGTDLSKWMYNGSVGGRPADLGYTLGSEICRSYYELAADKKKALYDLLNTGDFVSLVRNSKYKTTIESK